MYKTTIAQDILMYTSHRMEKISIMHGQQNTILFTRNFVRFAVYYTLQKPNHSGLKVEPYFRSTLLISTLALKRKLF